MKNKGFGPEKQQDDFVKFSVGVVPGGTRSRATSRRAVTVVDPRTQGRELRPHPHQSRGSCMVAALDGSGFVTHTSWHDSVRWACILSAGARLACCHAASSRAGAASSDARPAKRPLVRQRSLGLHCPRSASLLCKEDTSCRHLPSVRRSSPLYGRPRTVAARGGLQFITGSSVARTLGDGLLGHCDRRGLRCACSPLPL